VEQHRGRGHQVVNAGKGKVRTAVAVCGEPRQLSGPQTEEPLDPRLGARAARMAQILRGGNFPGEVGRGTDPALQSPSLQRSSFGPRTVVLERISDQQGLTRGNRDALPKNGVERAIGISDREQAGWPRVGSPIAVTPIAGLAMDRVPFADQLPQHRPSRRDRLVRGYPGRQPAVLAEPSDGAGVEWVQRRDSADPRGCLAPASPPPASPDAATRGVGGHAPRPYVQGEFPAGCRAR